jgi:3-hydroxybutyryl-CoA dehydratase
MAFSDQHMCFEDVAIGQEWVSPARTVTQTDIVNFAGLSGDFNPIHVDHEFAKTTPFRQPIAHGLLIQAIGSGMAVSCPMMRTMAFVQIREWNFVNPVFIGDTVRLRSRVLEKHLKGRGRRGEVVWLRTIFNQDGKIVQEGINVTLVEGRVMKERTKASPPSDPTVAVTPAADDPTTATS